MKQTIEIYSVNFCAFFITNEKVQNSLKFLDSVSFVLNHLQIGIFHDEDDQSFFELKPSYSTNKMSFPKRKVAIKKCIPISHY